MTAATTAVPMLPPTVRTIAFTLVACPVCVAGTASMIALDIAAKTMPIAAPLSSPDATICHRWSCPRAGSAYAAVPSTAPMTSGSFAPYRRTRMPATGPNTMSMSVVGRRNSPACVIDSPKPYPAASGISSRVGTTRNVPNMRNPKVRPTAFAGQTRRLARSRMSISGSFRRELDEDERDQTHGPEGEHAQGLRGVPAPLAALADGEQQRDQRHRQDERADDVQPAGRPDGRLGHAERDPQQRCADQHEREPEQPLPRQVVDDRVRRARSRGPPRCRRSPRACRP